MKSFRSLLLGLLILICSQNIFAQFELVNAYPALTFTRPVDFQHSNDGTNRIFVVQQAGIISVFPNETNVNSSDIFLNIADRVESGSNEMGLLGLAFHPNYQNNGYFFVNYTAGTSTSRRTVIARYQVSSSNPDSADRNSEVILFEYIQPYSNHNGGQVAFGADGYLYIASGDGGDGGDPQNNAQNKSSHLGKILRIDVDNTEGSLNYAIPSDNPFKDNADGFKEEIFAWGLRNPWRVSFDPATDWLWCADVGQGSWEEISIIENGKNYGWRCYEGTHPFDQSLCDDTTEYIDPIFEYARSGGNCSVTGGYVYRGSQIPELYGKYIYGDYCSSRIWALEYDRINPANNQYLFNAPGNVVSFGTDQNNELYLLSFNGIIYKFSSIFNLSAPTNLTAASIDIQTVLLSWEDNSNIEDGFKIERKKQDGAFELIDSVAANVITYTDTTVDDTTHYTYRVYAFNEDSVSDYSNESSVITSIPVELISFAASPEYNSIKLGWSTATETNNGGFVIERISELSPGYTSGIWEKIGFVEGKGTTTAISYYNFIDRNPYNTGKIFYRLSQIDLDGKITYSNSVEINADFLTKDYRLEQNYPNPFNPSTIIKFNLPEESRVKITINNLLGEIVAEIIDEVKPAGFYESVWNANELSTGAYYAVMRAESQITDQSHFQVIKMMYLK